MMKTKNMLKKFFQIVACSSLLICLQARAVIEFEITQGIDEARPIAIVPFQWFGSTEKPPIDVAEIIANDLRRSGQFKPLTVTEMPELPTDHRQINFAKWRELGVESLVVGRISEVSNKEYKVIYELIDILQNPSEVKDSENNLYPYLLDQSATLVIEKGLRPFSHIIADRVFKHLTGIPGAFHTYVAYVTVNHGDEFPYRLFIADSDGYNPRQLLASKQPIMSPAWSPDSKRLAYVSFEEGRSAIYIRDLSSSKAEKVASFRGINGAPSFSPDGTKLALTLSHEGNPEIYVYDLATRQFLRLTNHWSIDTEPSWSPDGKHLIFTSDRGGKPQIYQVPSDGGKIKRITFKGDYNASGSYMASGDKIVMVHRLNDVFHLAVLDLTNYQLNVVTETRLDESPSFAPNGSMIIYATVDKNRQVLAMVSTDGRFKMRLPSSDGIVKSPAWSPFLPRQ